LRRHFGGRAAHNPRDALRDAFAVADQQVVAGELALDAVERLHLLAGLREPHDDAGPARRPRSNAWSGRQRSSIT